MFHIKSDMNMQPFIITKKTTNKTFVDIEHNNNKT